MKCKDGIIEGIETCDDGGLGGCLPNCMGPAIGYICHTMPLTNRSNCSVVCGDGIVTPPETCDDGNKGSCTSNCSGLLIASSVVEKHVAST